VAARRASPIGEDQLGSSAVILPPADVSLQEAKAELRSEGPIPG